MKIVYETNGKGVLGWLVDLPGAYIRGRTIDEARSKIEQEITDYENWLGIKTESDDEYTESVQECNLKVEMRTATSCLIQNKSILRAG